MDFSRFHASQHSDSLLRVLTSLGHWTPFPGTQDRFGQLVPLLAVPVREPLANLLLETFLTITAGWCTLFFLVRYALPEGDARLPFALAAISVAALPENMRFDLFATDQPYGTSMALTLAGLLLIRQSNPGGAPLAALLILLGGYVNAAVVLVAAPLVVLVPGTRWKLALSLLAGACLASRLAGRLFVGHGSGLESLLPLSQWPQAWSRFAAQVQVDCGLPWEVLVALTLGLGLLGLPRSHPSLRSARMLLLVAFTCFSATCPFEHVRLNDYGARYAIPSILAVGAGAGIVAAALIPRCPPILALALALISFASCYGCPGLTVPREALEQRWGATARDLLDARASDLAGGYWRVWPVVFWARQLSWDDGRRDSPWALSWPWVDRARGHTPERIAVLYGDKEARVYLPQLWRPERVVIAEYRKQLCVLRLRRHPAEPEWSGRIPADAGDRETELGRIDAGTPAARPALKAGFSHDENEGPLTFTWSCGSVSQVSVWLDSAGPGRLLVRACGLPELNRVGVAVELNGQSVGSLRFGTSWETQELTLPATLEGENVLIFRYDKTGIPQQLRPGNLDPRRLAVRFDSIEIRPTSEASKATAPIR